MATSGIYPVPPIAFPSAQNVQTKSLILKCFGARLPGHATSHLISRLSRRDHHRPIAARGRQIAGGRAILHRECEFDAHNRVQTRAGVPKLTWSRQLTARASDWAASLVARSQFAHRSDSEYGENVFAISGGRFSPSKFVSEWGLAFRDCDLRSNYRNGVCRHDTQIF